jgi:DNA-binding NtrC family response regulator
MNENKKIRILLAEDDMAIREILTELLIEEGYECIPSFDGKEAAEKLKTETFDVLVSDFRMPRMDGVELLKWCRSNHIHLPVIFITANKDLFPKEKLALNDCCAALLEKPIDINKLLEAIHEAKTRNHHRFCEL